MDTPRDIAGAPGSAHARSTEAIIGLVERLRATNVFLDALSSGAISNHQMIRHCAAGFEEDNLAAIAKATGASQ